jgi:tetratricopeptide (TPR) repeat protein
MRVAMMVSALCLAAGAAGLVFAPEVLSAADVAAVTRTSPETARQLFDQAAAELRAGDPDAAAAIHRRILDEFPNDKAATVRASDALRAYHARRFERDPAETHYARQIALDPANAAARAQWAREQLLAFADYEGAIATAREALAMEDAAETRHTLALALYMKWAVLLSHKKTAEAQPFYEEAKSLWSDLNAVTKTVGRYRALEHVHLALTDPTSWAFRPYHAPAR